MVKALRPFIYCLRAVRVEESWDVISRFYITSCLQGMACEVIDWKDPLQVGGFISVGCESMFAESRRRRSANGRE